MKWKIILGMIFFLLVGIDVYAEENYIVKFNESIHCFSDNDLKHNSDRNYCVATSQELNDYLEAGIVEYYEVDAVVELFSENKNLEAINYSFSQKIGCLGNGVNIAVIDSGVEPILDMSDSILEGYNYLDGTYDTSDNMGHGTFVSSIIVSDSVGMAYKANIVPLKCFDSESTTYLSDILDAIYDSVDKYNCQVINMSFGLATNYTSLKDAIDYVTEKGVIVVAAVGNKGNSTLYYPAAYDNVIGVGSIGDDLEISDFSQINSSVFVVAPGEEINGISINGYTTDSGTSFAAPHISSLAAIVKSMDKSISTEEFKTILAENSTDLGEQGYDYYFGYGLIDCEATINKIIKNENIYISPISKENGKCSVVVYNNTELKKQMCCIYACYGINNLLVDINVEQVNLDPYSIYVFSNDYDVGVIKYMVWDNLQNLCPLTECRME